MGTGTPVAFLLFAGPPLPDGWIGEAAWFYGGGEPRAAEEGYQFAGTVGGSPGPSVGLFPHLGS